MNISKIKDWYWDIVGSIWVLVGGSQFSTLPGFITYMKLHVNNKTTAKGKDKLRMNSLAN